MKSLLITAMTLVSLILMSGTAYSADLDKAMQAYDKGDFKTALAEAKPLADKVIQTSIGRFY